MPTKETDAADTADTAMWHTTSSSSACAQCSSTEWTNAELTFQVHPFALTLYVKGAELLVIYYAFRSKEQILQWTKRLSQPAPPISVKVRTKSKVTECIYADNQVTKDTELYGVASYGMCWRARLSCALVLDCDVLTLDHPRGTTEVIVPAASWRDLDALFPMEDAKRPTLDVVFHQGLPREDDDEEEDDDEVDDGDYDVDYDNPLFFQKQGGPELPVEALALWERCQADNRDYVLDGRGFPLLSGWQNGMPVLLWQNQIWPECKLGVHVHGSNLVLVLRRNNGVAERTDVALSDTSLFLVEELAAGFMHEVNVNYVPRHALQETKLAVEDRLLKLTFGHTMQRITLPPTPSGEALRELLAELGPVACTHVELPPSRKDLWRVWWWNTQMSLCHYRKGLIALGVMLVLLLWLAVRLA